ncbi:MAG TPA: PTS sugar transporter subunit IIA [Planctomycetota bacterium]|nr:PTS sugar transporter subunit IIA [Planctomycetota bacterium]
MELTVREVARYLGVSEKEIYRWVSEGSIPLHQVGGHFRFNRTELLEWANARNVKVSTAIYRKEEDTRPLPSVAEALEAGGVLYHLAGAQKAAVLRSMIDGLPFPPSVDREMIYQILLAREGLGTTAIGYGIALPHVRHPIILQEVPSPRITLCFLEEKVDFGAPDGLPVHTLFWLVSPSVRSHAHMLARLAALVQNKDFQTLLSRRPSVAEILNETRLLESRLASVAEPDPGARTSRE